MNTYEILLVEDNPGDVGLVRKALEREGLDPEIRVARDAQEALALLRDGRQAGARMPKLVLLDLNLPGMDGRELLEVIKGDPAFARIPVVVLSTSSAAADIAHAYELHANSFLTKPGTLRELQGLLSLLCAYWLGAVKLPEPVA